MAPAVKCLILLAIIAICFITELIPIAMTALLGAIACGILGFIPAKAVFYGFADNNVVLFIGMFVVGASMFHTGLAQRIGETVVRMAGTSENRLMFGIMLVTAALSAVLSNTGTTACIMPVVLGICSAAKMPASRQLMPLAIAAGLGGAITMVGTPPNLIVTAALSNANLKTFGFFEFAYIGIPLTICGIIYFMLIGKYFLPKRALDADQEIEQEVIADPLSQTPRKQCISGIILIVVVIAMALNLKWFSLSMAAMTGGALCVLLKLLTEKQAYVSVDWVTVILLGGMMPVASSLEKTGAGKLIADVAVAAMGGSPTPLVVMVVLFIIACSLTQFMSNTAATALLAPVGIAISEKLGASPQAVLMAIAMAATCAFASPVGTPPNTLVLGPGGYKFMDYVKAGTGLIFVCFIVCMIVIPMVWPFFPGK